MPEKNDSLPHRPGTIVNITETRETFGRPQRRANVSFKISYSDYTFTGDPKILADLKRKLRKQGHRFGASSGGSK